MKKGDRVRFRNRYSEAARIFSADGGATVEVIAKHRGRRNCWKFRGPDGYESWLTISEEDLYVLKGVS